MSSGPNPVFIGSEIYRASRYGGLHPLSIPRVSTVIDIAWAAGWLEPEIYLDSPMATPTELSRFHIPRYIAAVRWAERAGTLPERVARRFQLGYNGNPIYREVFRRPATACGASLLAAELLLHGERNVVFSPAGGTHHGRSDRASGFCYFNDPVLAILRLLDSGVDRVLYLDIDAHHCDGVQDALAGDPRVRIVSIHEHDRWPRTGALDDTGNGIAVNVPVPERCNDTEFRFVFDTLMLGVLEKFSPDVVILQAGADALQEDPLSKLALSNNAIWDAVAQLRERAGRLLILGGGGYNPWTVARCWAGIWGVLTGEDPRVGVLASQVSKILRDLTWPPRPRWQPPQHLLESLVDVRRDGPIREAVKELVRTLEPRVNAEAGRVMP